MIMLASAGSSARTLYHRLTVIETLVPPLREPGEEILPLAQDQETGIEATRN